MMKKKGMQDISNFLEVETEVVEIKMKKYETKACHSPRMTSFLSSTADK